jgi:pimeloyl-ACP methyl ester carboxylesterase
VLHLERSGDGEPVVFLHGAAGSSATYGWLPDLGRTVIRPDFRGHGRSSRVPGGYLLGDYVDDALSVLRETGPAVLVGHSLGGVVAWTVAQRHPELVTSIVLEDPPLFLGEPAEHARNGAVPHFIALRADAQRWQSEGTGREAVIAELAAMPYGADPSRSAGDVAAEDAISARAHSLLHVDVAMFGPIIDGTCLAPADLAAPLGVPALIVAADDAFGAAFQTRHAERLAGSHPEVRVQRITGAGHSIHDETAHRTAYLRAVAERLDS